MITGFILLVGLYFLAEAQRAHKPGLTLRAAHDMAAPGPHAIDIRLLAAFRHSDWASSSRRSRPRSARARQSRCRIIHAEMRAAA